MVDKVLERAISARDEGQLDDWQALQHKLRTPTYSVIWRFEYTQVGFTMQQHVGGAVNAANVLKSAQKALFKAQGDRSPGWELRLDAATKRFEEANRRHQMISVGGPLGLTTTRGTKAFHDTLRALFTTHPTIKGYLAALVAFVEAQIWNGDVPAHLRQVKAGKAGLAIYIDDTNPDPDVELGHLGEKQAINKEKMLADIAGAS
jgi:hypothetical protein